MCKFLSVVVIAFSFTWGAAAATSNLSAGNIGEYGTWATEENRSTLIKNLSDDISKFSPNPTKQLVADYVPTEVKVGTAFVNAMTHVGNIIDNSLARFAALFMILMYVFWIMFEAYNNIKKAGDVKELGHKIIVKTLKIAFWIVILNAGPARVFTWVMTPIVQIGTYAADFILNAVASTVGLELPDTCSAIHAYVAAHTPQGASIDAPTAANIMCLPTRLSGYFTSGVALGWGWVKASIGNSLVGFLMGFTFVILFIINAWKFAFMAFGVIADLFLATILLPFTAIAETVSKTSYDQIPGTIYNGFAGLLKAENLKTQIMRVINAALYFIILSVIIAICVVLAAGVLTINNASSVPSVDLNGFVPTLTTGFLIYYLAKNADKIAKDWGGSVNSALGDSLRGDVEKLIKSVGKNTKELYNKITESKKK